MNLFRNLSKFHSRNFVTQFFVPQHKPVNHKDIEVIKNYLSDKPNILIVTGAGISTESGIPDYRSEGVGLYQRSNHKPVQYPEFIRSHELRKRYWARNFLGWPRFSAVKPNLTHKRLAEMEIDRRLCAIVTQNVDNLHSKAGSEAVTELHGNGYKVICIGHNGKNRCGYSISRDDFQLILASYNQDLKEKTETMHAQSFRPDGDVEISSDDIKKFYLPQCPQCMGDLKPNIVFFGDNIPLDRIESVVKLINDSDGILVLGSSLQVFSGYRIILQAKELNLPTAIINIGATRADHLVDLKINAKCSDILTQL